MNISDENVTDINNYGSTTATPPIVGSFNLVIIIMLSTFLIAISFICIGIYSCNKEQKRRLKPIIYIEPLFQVVTTEIIDSQVICVICLEPLGKKKHGELSCNHKFHTKCIKEWMEKSTNKDCPLCRK